MDANGQFFLQLRGGAPWRPADAVNLELTPEHLRLASPVQLPDYGETPVDATALLTRCPSSRDRYGAIAHRITLPAPPDSYAVLSQPPVSINGQPAPITLLGPLPGISDIALSPDDRLYVPAADGVHIRDLQGLHADALTTLPGFTAWRIAPFTGGAWVLEAGQQRLALLSGKLPPLLPPTQPPSYGFTDAPGQAPAPLLEERRAPTLAAGESIVAMDSRPGGLLALLAWTATGAALLYLDTAGNEAGRQVLRGLQRPHSLRWLDDTRLALLAPSVREAVVYSFSPGSTDSRPLGEVYPLRDHNGAPFVHAPAGSAEYEVGDWTSAAPATRPVVAASLPAYASEGSGLLASPLDGGRAGLTWHRIYAEAELPAGTGISLQLAASDMLLDPAEIAPEDWHPHLFGDADAADRRCPRGAWVPGTSEIPNHPGFLEDAPVPQRNGLFTVLIQRHNRPVRSLVGRYLFLRVVLNGSLRSTPCLHALRIYGPRFSYQDKYLPALYRETLFGTDAEQVTPPGTPATRPDFLGRLLSNFEGILTTLEDKVAASWMLTDPATAPDSALPWLGSWVGMAFETWYPPEHRRALLLNASRLASLQGTLDGVRLAIDIATGGWVTAKRAVVVEDFRMRRSFQTVLGVDLDKLDDPLLGVPMISGNSRIGRTLILGEEGQARRFLALFDSPASGSDPQEVSDFLASLAFRVTILVHDTLSAPKLDLITRVAAKAVPAHVTLRVRAAERDFVVGVASLLGVDTFIERNPPPPDEVVGLSSLGDGSRLDRPASLYPTLEYSS
jgi:phage tail-like protein